MRQVTALEANNIAKKFYESNKALENFFNWVIKMSSVGLFEGEYPESDDLSYYEIAYLQRMGYAITKSDDSGIPLKNYKFKW